MTLSEELAWRGFSNQTTYPDLSVLNGSPINFYWGVDPSADSMQVGNLAAAMMVKAFMRHGHQPVLLIGGATGLIGDPDGKSEERTLKAPEEIADNKKAIVGQYHRIFENKHLKVVDNHDWFAAMRYLDFLRDIGKHVPMRQMMARDFVQTRLTENGPGISYAEFSYVLIQAYDFLHLYENHGVTLQVCGSDQWGNSIAGVDLIRRKTGAEAHVFSAPLVVNTATGRKFGKTEDGAVWLNPAKTTPTAFYQFWVNADDEGVEAYLKIFTELDQPEVEKIMAQHRQYPSSRVAQMRLAEEITRLVHGEAAMQIAKEVTSVLRGKIALGEADEETLATIRQEIPTFQCSLNTSLAVALVHTGLASSNTEARHLLQSNAISINSQKVSHETFEPADFQNGRLLLRRGKAFKDSALIELN